MPGGRPKGTTNADRGLANNIRQSTALYLTQDEWELVGLLRRLRNLTLTGYLAFLIRNDIEVNAEVLRDMLNNKQGGGINPNVALSQGSKSVITLPSGSAILHLLRRHGSKS